MSITESMLKEAALGWFQELGYAVGPVPQLAQGEPAAQLGFFDDLALVGRLCVANLQTSRGITQLD
jgi:type I restriction enzyme R subunit